ncbi:glucose 1-dehydrogenase [Amycolatopsis acidicola]|uniref:SDR family NAD(P)-dependent oxidoreductase n=1 Tax=Amycolatopsis acidicola TaxID=2596893 RepID=UPI00312C95A6
MTTIEEAVAAVREGGQPLQGRTALVTGGSRGLGREISIAFAAAGANVAVASRKKDACESLAEELAAATGRSVTAHGAHVGEWDGLGPLLDEVEQALGPVDILVNNAGIAPTYPSLAEVSETLFDKVIGVNLKGPFRLMAVAGERMAARGGGAILNISSMASGRPTAGDLPYAAAKAALNTLTAGFAQEYGPGVRVNTILAGPFRTDISKHWDPDTVADMAKAWPSKRVGNPEEIVGAALYLCGPNASYTTGALLAVDGGRLAAP